jgi:hypothetical protein
MFAGDFSAGEYLAVYVQYNPVSDKWGMQYAASTASFPDSLTAVYTPVANITDITYVSSPGFQFSGMLHNHLPGAINQAFFDNITSLQQWALPITLSNFDANAEGNDVKLHWVTESEIDNNYFTLEHSTDGLSFLPIGQVTGAGTSTAMLSYDFQHSDVTAGDHYYRLRQTDFDGQESVSEIIHVYVTATISATELYPNPVKDQLQLRFISSLSGDATLTITAINGQEIANSTVSSLEGINTYNLNTASLTPGIYFLRINGNASSNTLRFVVQE